MPLPAVTVPHWLAAFALLAAAHTTPWATGRAFGHRWAQPIDGGIVLSDGGRLFGAHKTWRGLLASLATCTLLAWLLAYPAALGLEFAALAMSGDLLTSALKRRLRLAPGREVPGLDQLPEALLPLLALAGPLGITLPTAGLLSAVFLLFDLAALPLRHD